VLSDRDLDRGPVVAKPVARNGADFLYGHMQLVATRFFRGVPFACIGGVVRAIGNTAECQYEGNHPTHPCVLHVLFLSLMFTHLVGVWFAE
jgi:hypothetical protein